MKLSKAQKYKQKWDKENLEHKRKQQYERRKERRKWFEEEILAKCKCEKCGQDHPATIDFHHKDPSQKEGMVGDMVMQKYGKDKILAEIAKCEVLCSNCHRIHHWNERNNERGSSSGKKSVL